MCFSGEKFFIAHLHSLFHRHCSYNGIIKFILLEHSFLRIKVKLKSQQKFTIQISFATLKRKSSRSVKICFRSVGSKNANKQSPFKLTRNLKSTKFIYKLQRSRFANRISNLKQEVHLSQV